MSKPIKDIDARKTRTLVLLVGVEVPKGISANMLQEMLARTFRTSVHPAQGFVHTVSLTDEAIQDAAVRTAPENIATVVSIEDF